MRLDFEILDTNDLEFELVNIKNVSMLVNNALLPGMAVKELVEAHNFLMERKDKLTEILKKRPDANQSLLTEKRGIPGIQGD